MMIVVGGMIGGGKSSLAKLIGGHFETEVFFESVEDNKILPLFYEDKEGVEKKRYAFLLQLWFLDTRFRDIKKALTHDNNVLDRSIYEDWYFAKVNHKLGRISDLEFELYEKLLFNMMEELKELPKKAPDLMVYLKGSFETFISRIENRARGYEAQEGDGSVDDDTKAYFYELWKDYDAWLENHYDFSDVVVIDIDKVDYVNNQEDAKMVIEMIESKLLEVRGV